MKRCTTCGRPVSTRHSGSDTHKATRCLICITAEQMCDFRYPAQPKQRKERDHGDR